MVLISKKLLTQFMNEIYCNLNYNFTLSSNLVEWKTFCAPGLPIEIRIAGRIKQASWIFIISRVFTMLQLALIVILLHTYMIPGIYMLTIWFLGVPHCVNRKFCVKSTDLMDAWSILCLCGKYTPRLTCKSVSIQNEMAWYAMEWIKNDHNGSLYVM